MLTDKDKTQNYQPRTEPTPQKNQQVKTSESEAEVQKKALEEYQKLGPDEESSVDIIHKP